MREATEALHLSRPTIYKLIRKGDIKSWTIGRDRRISAASVIEYLHRMATAAP
jgi:excisionase family DNA binding protein